MVAKAVEGLVPVVSARIPEEVLHTPHPFKDPIVPIMSRCACSRPAAPQSGPSPQSAPLHPRRRALSAGGCLVALVLALTPALAGCDDSLAEDTPTTDSASATAAAEEAGEEQDQQQAQNQPESDQTEQDQTESDQTQEQSGGGGSSGVYYANCKEARAAGAAPLHRGDPGYRAGLDRDDDGIACEWKQGQPEQDSSQEQSGGSSGTFYKNCSEARAAGAAPIYRGEPGYREKLDRDNDGIACEK